MPQRLNTENETTGEGRGQTGKINAAPNPRGAIDSTRHAEKRGNRDLYQINRADHVKVRLILLMRRRPGWGAHRSCVSAGITAEN